MIPASPFIECLGRLVLSSTATLLIWATARRWTASALGAVGWDIVLCASAVGLAVCLVASAMLLGTLGWLHYIPWLATACLGDVVWRRALRRVPADEAAAPDKGGPSRVYLVALASLLLGRVAFGMRNPPADWDSIQYHLPMLGYWLQSGTLGVPVREPAVLGMGYPGNAELLDLWAACATGRDSLVTWPGILAYGVLALATRRLALNSGARATAAEVVSLLFIGAPGVLQLTLGLRVDPILTACLATALLFAQRFRVDGRAQNLSVMLLALGLLTGTRANGPLLALAVMAAAFAGPGARDRLRSLASRRTALALALLAGGFWTARNLLVTGNPLYPVAISLGPLRLTGLEGSAFLAGTSQIAIWLGGHAGHATPARLLSMYGAFLPALAIGLALSGLKPGKTGTTPGAMPWAFGVLAAFAFVIFLVSPFSGSFRPAMNGLPPGLNYDNLRQLMPVLVALAPLAAVGLSRLPDAVVVASGAVLVLAGLRGSLRSMLAGLAVAGAVAVAWPRLARVSRSAWARALAGAAGLLALALLVTAVEPMRGQITDIIWDDYTTRLPNLPARHIRALMGRAHGAPVAITGAQAWWAYYGRDFGGHPIYVPVSLAWETASRPYAMTRDDRDRARPEVWLDNLGRSGARFVVVAAHTRWWGGGFPPERGWMRDDPRRFRLVAGDSTSEAYEVLPSAGAVPRTP